MRYIDEYLPVFTAKNKNKLRKDNQLCEIEIREVDNEKKRIKIHYKGFSEDTDEWRDYGRRISRCSKFRIDISVRFSIHSTTLQVIFLPCSHVFKSFAVLKSSF